MWKQRQQLKRQALLEERAQAMRHQPAGLNWMPDFASKVLLPPPSALRATDAL
jgi:hypothetical protein